MRVGLTATALTATLALASACGVAAPMATHQPSTGHHTGTTAALPAPSHVVVVVEENRSYSDIIGSGDAPYLNSLAKQGASFTASFAETHPSEPNYLALFAGDTFGLSSDKCPVTENAANLGNELLTANKTFTGYSESLPSAGYTGCTSGDYARKHAPWVDFPSIPAADNQPYTKFPSGSANLPTLSFVIPNLQHDMHDGSIAQGDSWLKSNLDSYLQWAKNNNSLLVVTWDEDDGSQTNQIPTIVAGAHVKAGTYSEKINHYNVLRTLEDFYGLPHAGKSAGATPITDIWS